MEYPPRQRERSLHSARQSLRRTTRSPAGGSRCRGCIEQNIRIENRTGRFGFSCSAKHRDRAAGSLVNISAASPRSSVAPPAAERVLLCRPRRSLRAATNPSPPLFPFPQITPTRLAEGYCDGTKSATALPAFSMSVREGTPNRSLVTRSISRISAAVTIFIVVVVRFLAPVRGADHTHL